MSYTGQHKHWAEENFLGNLLYSILNILASELSNRVILEGWYRANISLAGLRFAKCILIWNLFLADFIGNVKKSFFTVNFDLVDILPIFPFLSPPLSLTHTTASSYTRKISFHYVTMVGEFIFQIWMGEFTLVRRTFMLKPLKWKYHKQTFFGATGNEPDCDWVWSLYYFQG